MRSLLFIMCLSISSCQILGPEEKGRLELHIQASFHNTPVRISLDSEIVFDSLATTDQIIGLAGGVTLEAPSGIRTLDVIVDNQYEHSQKINLGRELFVGIQFYQKNEIMIVTSTERFYYH